MRNHSALALQKRINITPPKKRSWPIIKFSQRRRVLFMHDVADRNDRDAIGKMQPKRF